MKYDIEVVKVNPKFTRGTFVKLPKTPVSVNEKAVLFGWPFLVEGLDHCGGDSEFIANEKDSGVLRLRKVILAPITLVNLRDDIENVLMVYWTGLIRMTPDIRSFCPLKGNRGAPIVRMTDSGPKSLGYTYWESKIMKT